MEEREERAMSVFITIEEVQSRLPELLREMIPGEERIITENDRIVARLTRAPLPPDKPRQLGTLKGTVLYMAPDFDEPLDDFKDSME
jgi:antitoxin (DNA-binding transcriptional repressor) of toxin-antitoxin stability system